MLKIVIPINPVTKKNHGQMIPIKSTKINPKTGKAETKMRNIMLPSKPYQEYEKKCKQYMPTLERPIDFPINLKVLYFMETRRKCDITNLLQATCDILVKYKIIEDDNYSIVASFDGTRASYDKGNPRCEIYIERIKEDA